MHAAAERFSFARCTACGLVYLDPRVPAASLGHYYTAAYLPYRGPDAWGRWKPFVRAGLRRTDRARVARVRRHISVGPDTRVLDVGCGHPTFLEALGREAPCARVGIDFSDEGWREDRVRWAGIDLIEGGLTDAAVVESPAFSDAPFDVVTMWHYLEHDYDPHETLKRVHDVSAPGARLFIEVPDHSSWSQMRYREHWAGYHTPRHTALWDPDTMRVLLERSGWAVESIERTGTLDPWVLVWMSRQERAGIDWAQSMEPRFPAFLFGRVVMWPALRLRERLRGRGGDGLLTAVARPG